MSEVNSFISRFSGLTEEYKFYDGTVTLRYDPKDHVYLLVKDDGTLEKQEGVTTICHILDKSQVLIPWACKMMAQKILGTIPSTEELQGLNYDSFTKVVNSSKSAHREKLEDAGNVGHIAHAWIESYIKAVLEKDGPLIEQILGSFPAEDRAKSACIAALDWMHQHNVRWLGTERKIYSKYYKYAGTMDGLCVADSCDNPNCCRSQFKDRLTIADWKTSNYLYVEFILQTAAYKQAYQEETKQKVEDIWIIRLGKEDAEFEAWHVDLVLAAKGWAAFTRALDLKRAMDEVEGGVELMRDFRKSARKAERKARQAVNRNEKCPNAVKYKGKRKPICNGGNPCQSCLKKYAEEQEAKAKRLKELADSKPTKKAKLTSPELLKSLNFLLDMKT
jgi:hypothetical protein